MKVRGISQGTRCEPATNSRVLARFTGSTGIQLIPQLAKQARHLYVFQRTANFSMPAWLDALIGLVVITPGQHFMHHLREQEYTDSQFGIIFPFWDRILGTLRKAPDRKTKRNGLDGWDSETDQTVFGMLASMFDHEERARMRARVGLARS